MEFAIVLPAMLLMIFGVIDFGRAIQQQIQITEAVREGARVGALNGTAAEMQSQVTSFLGSGVTVTFTTTTTCVQSSSTTATVVATRSYTAITPVFALLQYFGTSASSTFTIGATGVMACTG